MTCLIWLRDLGCLLLVGFGLVLMVGSALWAAASILLASPDLIVLGIAGLAAGIAMVRFGERWL